MHHGDRSDRARFTSKVGRVAPLILLFTVIAATLAPSAWAGVYHSRESALRLAFPGCASIETQNIVLDDEQVEAIQREAGAELPSKLLRAYVGTCDDVACGFAFIDTHRVRSLPETVMVVVGPDGRIRGTHLLAFHEPEEYMPSGKWLGQFAGEELDRDMALGRGIAGIAGSTLSAQAVTACVRRAAAVAKVCLIDEAEVSSGSGRETVARRSEP